MQVKKVLNAVQNAVECKVKSIKIHYNGINITFLNFETHD